MPTSTSAFGVEFAVSQRFDGVWKLLAHTPLWKNVEAHCTSREMSIFWVANFVAAVSSISTLSAFARVGSSMSLWNALI